MKTKNVIASLALVGISAAALIAVPVYAGNHGQGPMGSHGERPSFDTLDADGDGSITIAELKSRSADQFGEQDINGDGILTAEELTTAITERARQNAEVKVERLIQWRDTDGDGALSQTELGGNMGERMFGRLDANNDGAISKEEYETAAKLRRGKRMGGPGNRHSDG